MDSSQDAASDTWAIDSSHYSYILIRTGWFPIISRVLPRVSTKNYCLSPDSISLSNLVLIIYHTVLTLPREIDLLWGKRFRVAVLLYIMARYLVIINRLLVLVLNNIVMPTAVIFLFMCMWHHVCCWPMVSVCEQFIIPLQCLMCQFRACSNIAHLFDALEIVALVGVLGKPNGVDL